MAKKPDAVKLLASLEEEAFSDEAFNRALELIHHRLDHIEDHLIGLFRSMGHIGIPSFKPYSGDE